MVTLHDYMEMLLSLHMYIRLYNVCLREKIGKQHGLLLLKGKLR